MGLACTTSVVSLLPARLAFKVMHLHCAHYVTRFMVTLLCFFRLDAATPTSFPTRCIFVRAGAHGLFESTFVSDGAVLPRLRSDGERER